MNNLKLVLEYDGAGFLGFQVQSRGRTVQGEVERAIAAVTSETVRVHGAGRTDSGVHAAGQVVNVHTATALDPATLQRALNAHLPRDIAVLSAEVMDDAFHARFSAVRRRYRYLIWHAPVRSPLRSRRSWHVRGPLDVETMRAAAARLVGHHDFAAFSAADPELKGTVRRLERLDVAVIEVAPEGELIAIDAAANAFLPHMVRNLAGTLVAAGQARLTPEAVSALLAGRDRRQAPATAPAHALCLVGVDYGPSGHNRIFVHETGSNGDAGRPDGTGQAIGPGGVGRDGVEDTRCQESGYRAEP